MKKLLMIALVIGLLATGVVRSPQALAAVEPTATLIGNKTGLGLPVGVEVADLSVPKQGDGKACKSYQEVYREVSGERFWHGATTAATPSWSFVNTYPVGNYSGLKLRISFWCDGVDSLPSYNKVLPLGTLEVSNETRARMLSEIVRPGAEAKLFISGYQPNESVKIIIKDSSGVEVSGWGYSIVAKPDGTGSQVIPTTSRPYGRYQVQVVGTSSAEQSVNFEIRNVFSTTPGEDVFPTRRVGGNSLYETGVDLSKFAQYPTGGVVFIATSRSFLDAASVGTAAYLQNSPVLFSDHTYLPKATADELVRLKPKKVYLLGSTWALSDEVEAAVLKIVGPVLERIGGNNAMETSIMISNKFFGGGADSVIVATDRHFSDSLTVSPVASRVGAPVLLASWQGVSRDKTIAEIKRLRAKNVYILGSSWSLPNSLDADIQAAVPGISTKRFAGSDPHDTTVMVNKFFAKPSEIKRIYLVMDELFYDGLSAAPVAAKTNGILLLSQRTCTRKVTRDYASTLFPEEMIIVGSTWALSDKVKSMTLC